MRARTPIAAGVALAAAAAIAFGVTAPVIARAGVAPLTTASLLYAGAALSAVGRRKGGARLQRSDAPRVLVVAVLGGAIAPVLLAWGLARAGGTVGALLLHLEAVFTVLLARAIVREPIGHRAALALAVMTAAAAALVLDTEATARAATLGALAVAAATLAWALDNTLGRPLADREPLDVILAKGALGASFTGVAALASGEPRPTLAAAGALLACGATGYGLSLRFYLHAQRRIGAARTGSVFALAPFVGAAIAWGLGDRAAGPWAAVAAGLFGLGVWLHVTEQHGHEHVHQPVTHDHPHRHDDGHHEHVHDPPVTGEHAHQHDHQRIDHAHEHAPDLHHTHH